MLGSLTKELQNNTMKYLILVSISFIAGAGTALVLFINNKAPSAFTEAFISNAERTENAELIWSENDQFSTLIVESENEIGLSIALKSHPSIVAYVDGLSNTISIKGSGKKKVVLNFGKSNSSLDLLTIHDFEEKTPVAYVDRMLDGSFDEKYIFDDESVSRLSNVSSKDWRVVEVD